MGFTTSQGIRIHTEETGHGEPVLYLHSGPGRGGDWRSIVERLGNGYTHLMPDLHDRGRSERWPDPDTYSLDCEAQMAAELIGARGGRAHVVGHSYGGAVAARLAGLAPRCVHSLTVVEPQIPGLLREAGEDRLHAAMLAFYDAVFADMDTGEVERGWERFIDEFNGAGGWAALPERVKDRIRASTDRLQVYWAALQNNRVGFAELGSIAVPTLVILGEQTTVVERRKTEIFAARVPGARCVTIPNAAHMAPLTHPDEVASLLAAHLAAHPFSDQG